MGLQTKQPALTGAWMSEFTVFSGARYPLFLDRHHPLRVELNRWRRAGPEQVSS